MELINESVPFERLEARVNEVAEKLAKIPLSQLQAQKLIVNQAYENMGLSSTQTLGGILDGLMRNTPDALAFIETARRKGFGARSSSATARGATTARRRRSGVPTRRTSSSPSTDIRPSQSECSHAPQIRKGVIAMRV